MFPCRPYFGVHIDGSPGYRCEIIRKFLNTAVRRKATAAGIAESTNVVSGIIRGHKIYPDRNLTKRVIS